MRSMLCLVAALGGGSGLVHAAAEISIQRLLEVGGSREAPDWRSNATEVEHCRKFLVEQAGKSARTIARTLLGNPLIQFPAFGESSVTALALSDDGGQILTGQQSGQLVLQAMASEERRFPRAIDFPHSEWPVSSVAFLPDGFVSVHTEQQSSEIRFQTFSRASGNALPTEAHPLPSFGQDILWRLRVARRGGWVAALANVAPQDPVTGSARLFQVSDGGKVSASELDLDAVSGSRTRALELASPGDRNLLLFGNWEGAVGALDLDRPKSKPMVLLKPQGERQAIFASALSRDHDRVAFGTRSGKVHVWRLDGSRFVREVSPFQTTVRRGRPRFVDGLVFSPDGGTLLARFFDGTAEVWEVGGRQAKRRGELKAPSRSLEFSDYAFSPDGSVIAGIVPEAGAGSRRTGRLVLFSAETLRPIREVYLTPSHRFTAAAFSDEGLHFAVATDGGEVLRFNWLSLLYRGLPSVDGP